MRPQQSYSPSSPLSASSVAWQNIITGVRLHRKTTNHFRVLYVRFARIWHCYLFVIFCFSVFCGHLLFLLLLLGLLGFLCFLRFGSRLLQCGKLFFRLFLSYNLELNLGFYHSSYLNSFVTFGLGSAFGVAGF